MSYVATFATGKTEEKLFADILYVIHTPRTLDEQSVSAVDYYRRQAKAEGFRSVKSYLKSCLKDGTLGEMVSMSGAGMNDRHEKTIAGILAMKVPLSRVSREELKSIYGINNKQCRYFEMMKDPNAKVAILDTHLRRACTDIFGIPDMSHESDEKYDLAEKEFLSIAAKIKASPLELHVILWLINKGVFLIPPGDPRSPETWAKLIKLVRAKIANRESVSCS